MYELIQRLPASDFRHFSSLVIAIQGMPFHRYFSRSIQVSALLLLWPTCRWLQVSRLSTLFLIKNKYARADLLYAFVVALLPLWLLEVFFIWKGWCLFSMSFTLVVFLKIILTAAFVAVLEEVFFRGLLLGVSRPAFGDRGAMLFTSIFFAVLHFLNMPHQEVMDVHWSSGLVLCTQVGQGLPRAPLFLGAFVSLVVLGMILAWVTIRTNSLWLAIGLHAAWIFGQQSFNHVARYAIVPPDALLPWIGVSQVHGMVPVGILPLLPLVVTLLSLWLWLMRRGKDFS